ncbi:MAG: hypothetical protein L0Z51_06570 [Candidatus Latescibacteria bacterium]|nr:hypothetical protein [Candidatus Latescibacterota bacterium]
MSARSLLLPLTVLSIAIGMAACDQKPVGVADTREELQWTAIDSFPRSSSISALWGSGPDDVWVGYQGGVAPLRHFDGQSWEWIPFGLPSDVDDIWGSGPSDIYVATYNAVKHFDGAGWLDVGLSGQRITGTSANDVYLMDQNLVHHFDGADWDTLHTFANGNATPASAFAFTGNRLVVARWSYYGPDSLYRWDGTNWTSEAAPGLVRGFWGTTPDDMIAAGSDAAGVGAIWRWDGIQWSAMPLPQPIGAVRDLVGVASDQLYATTCCDGVLLRYDGANWQAESVPGAQYMTSTWASSSSDIFLAAGFDVLLHNDGTGWSTAIPGKPQYARVVWAESPQRLVVVGRYGVSRFDHGTWTTEDLGDWGGDPSALVGGDWNDLYLGDGNDGILHYDGAEWTPISDVNTYDLCPSPDGHLFAVTNDHISRWDGVAWTSVDAVNDYLYRVWAARSDYAIVLGANGTWKYDGSTLTKVADGRYGDVWGLSDREVYLTQRGGIVRYDGTTFHLFGPTEGGFEFVVGSGPDHIIGVGYPYSFVKSGGTWKSASGEISNEYIALVAALDGSIVRMTADSRFRLFSLSYHRP